MTDQTGGGPEPGRDATGQGDPEPRRGAGGLGDAGPGGDGPRVLRVFHAGVVREWRQRDAYLRNLGARVSLVTARRWDEGGGQTTFHADPGEDARAAATLGHHPCGFLYDPRPLWRALRAGNFDVVDVHEEPYSFAALEVTLLKVLLARRAKLVFYSAQNIYKRYPTPVRLAERLVQRVASGAYVCTPDAGDVLRRRGFTGTVRTIPLGIDPAALSPGGMPRSGQVPPHRAPIAGTGPPGRAGDPAPRLNVGFVGRVERRKGVFVLLEALTKRDGWQLTVAGGGPEAGALRAEVDRLSLGDRVMLLGHVDQAGLTDVYRSLDVLVVPSLPVAGWTEQFGRVAVEAMGCGTPVIVSDAGALPELVDGAALVVASADADAIVEALDRLDAQPELRASLAEAGLRRAAAFSWSKVAEDHLALYRSVLASPRGAEARE